MLEFLLIPLMGALNRFCGGGLGWKYLTKDHYGFLPGRPIWYIGLLLAVSFYYIFGWYGVLWATAFSVWREPSWFKSIDQGFNDHTTARDYFVMMGRALMPLCVLIPWCVVYGTITPILFLFGLSVAIPLSYLTAWKIGFKMLGVKDPVAVAEWMSGFAWGVVLLMAL